MKTQTLINILQVALLIAMIAGLVIALWTTFGPVHSSLATVSWNG